MSSQPLLTPTAHQPASDPPVPASPVAEEEPGVDPGGDLGEHRGGGQRGDRFAGRVLARRYHPSGSVEEATELAIGLARNTLIHGVAGFIIQPEEVVLLAPEHPPTQPDLYHQLWCRRAPSRWDGVVVRSEGTSRPVTPGDIGATLQKVSVLILVLRTGEVRAELTTPGRAEPTLCSLPPEGQLIDALRRYLGVTTADEPRNVADLVLTIWCDRLVAAELGREPAQPPPAQLLLACHPLFAVGNGERRVSPDTPVDRARVASELDRLVGLTRRLADDTTWEYLRELAAGCEHPFSGASSEEASWADAPMFARLLLDQYPCLFDLLDTLEARSSEWVVRTVRSHVAAVLAPPD